MKRIAASIAVAALAVSAAEAALVYTSGHADLGVAYEGGELDFHLHAEGATVGGVDVDDGEYAADEVVILVSPAAMLTVPVDFAPLGVAAGETIWVLPETENPVLPFLGLATEELSSGDWGNITFTLGGVTSPSGAGHFALWQTGSFGSILLRMSTADPGEDGVTMLPNTHSHYNYGFTEPGLWEIEMTVSGTHATDGFKSATETFTFQVVPEPSSVLLAGLGATVFLRRRRS